MRIATFNLENLDDGPGLDPPLDARVAVLRPQLLRLEADVLCLQEINAQRQATGSPRRLLALERLLESTPYANFHLVNSFRPGGKGLADKHNLAILSRWQVSSCRQIWHDLVPPARYSLVTGAQGKGGDDAIRWDRPILHAILAPPSGPPLHLVNLHLRAPLAAPVPGQKLGAFAWRSVGGWAEGFYLATVKRCGQALEARLLVEQILDGDPDAAIAVCGDFNAEEREMPLRIIRGDLEDTGNGELAGRSLISLERTLSESQRFSVVHHGHRLMLDHLLVSRALMARYRSVEVHNEALGDELVAYATVSRSPESYHAPVVASFSDS